MSDEAAAVEATEVALMHPENPYDKGTIDKLKVHRHEAGPLEGYFTATLDESGEYCW